MHTDYVHAQTMYMQKYARVCLCIYILGLPPKRALDSRAILLMQVGFFLATLFWLLLKSGRATAPTLPGISGHQLCRPIAGHMSISLETGVSENWGPSKRALKGSFEGVAGDIGRLRARPYWNGVVSVNWRGPILWSLYGAPILLGPY